MPRREPFTFVFVQLWGEEKRNGTKSDDYAVDVITKWNGVSVFHPHSPSPHISLWANEIPWICRRNHKYIIHLDGLIVKSHDVHLKEEIIRWLPHGRTEIRIKSLWCIRMWRRPRVHRIFPIHYSSTAHPHICDFFIIFFDTFAAAWPDHSLFVGDFYVVVTIPKMHAPAWFMHESPGPPFLHSTTHSSMFRENWRELCESNWIELRSPRQNHVFSLFLLLPIPNTVQCWLSSLLSLARSCVFSTTNF